MSSRPPAPAWMLILSYIAFFGFVPLLVEKRRREVRWHAKNGLLLFAALLAVGLAFAVVGIFIPSLSCLYVVVMFVTGSLYIVVTILAVVKALAGERLFVPGISRYADRF